ncbi:hypothetical protein HKCCE3408_16935 [Rhodobacterales bacterium HKCCE3408]|nr:hypothetical protein [Rhodobacterales bacterium HKCCE3408]
MIGLISQILPRLIPRQAGRNAGRAIVLGLLVGTLVAIAAGFAVAAMYMGLMLYVIPPLAAIITAGVLLFLACAIMLGAHLASRRRPPPDPDPVIVALAGFAAGLAAGRSDPPETSQDD